MAAADPDILPGARSSGTTGPSAGSVEETGRWDSPCLWLRRGMSRHTLQRYMGACNLQTDIKEAVFLGHMDAYVAAGSDDGRVYIWERRSGRLVRVLWADSMVVNCVQPHPQE
ncbi:hypothetical protein CYMTET_32113, partial [Cymbomonas tetramitiformis]